MATNTKGEVWMSMFHLGIILPALLFAFGVDSAIILEGPDNRTVPVGAIATFHCNAQGDDAYWKINDRAIDERMEDFVFDEHDCSTSTCNLTLSINAMPQNNNTIIICVALSDEGYSSLHAELIVIGPPSPPDPQLHMLNASTIQLSWLPPFTWMGYPIVNYSIEMNNRATGEVTNWAINATSAGSNVSSPVTFDYSTPYGEVVQRCEELVFTVYAANNLGQSGPGEVNGGFPIDPDSSSIGSIVTFQSDGTPLLQLRVQLLNICRFQELVYTITIQRVQPSHNANTGDIVIGPKTVRGQTEVHEVIDSGLVVNAVYSVLVDMDTVTGSISSSTTFRTHFQPTTEYTEDTTATSGTGTWFQPTTEYTDSTTTSGTGISFVGKIAIGASTGIFITVTSGMVLLILCACVIWKKRSEEKSAEKACKAMIPNPIYEGPLYESIHPQLSTLTTPGLTTNMMESRYLDKPIHPAMLNKAAKTSDSKSANGEDGIPNQKNQEENAEGEVPFLETHGVHIPGPTPSSDDNYTMMSPVGTLAHSLQGGWGIPDHSDPEETDKTGFE